MRLPLGKDAFPGGPGNTDPQQSSPQSLLPWLGSEGNCMLGGIKACSETESTEDLDLK